MHLTSLNSNAYNFNYDFSKLGGYMILLHSTHSLAPLCVIGPQIKLASIITQGIHKELFKCLGPKSRKLVMEKAFVNPTFQSCLLNSSIHKNLAITTQELITKMCVYLQEISSNSNVKLATKHIILTIVNARATNCSNVARVLGIHLRNIAATIIQLSLTCDSGRLSMRKKKLTTFCLLQEMK